MTIKRKYEQKIDKQLERRKEFLIERARKDWEEIQRGAKKEEIIRRAKTGGIVMGKVLLTMLFIGGVLTLAVVAPNIFAAAGRLLKQKSFFEKKEFKKSKNYLKKQKYIQFEKIDNDLFEMSITSKGRQLALKEVFDGLKVKPEKWDRIWRIVIFDIPNRHKWGRDALRHKLKQMGFYQLQESVFATPYSCEKEIDFVVSIFNVADYVRIIEAKSLNYDEDIKNFFHLS